MQEYFGINEEEIDNYMYQMEQYLHPNGKSGPILAQ